MSSPEPKALVAGVLATFPGKACLGPTSATDQWEGQVQESVPGTMTLEDTQPNLPRGANSSLSLAKVQGATRLGATGLRASERKYASERVSERTSENLSKISETSQKSLKTSKNL